MNSDESSRVLNRIPDTILLFIKNYLTLSNELCSSKPCFIEFITNRRNKFSKSYLNNAIQILLILQKHGKLRLSKLSEILNMNPGTVHNYVIELYNNGFLEIEKNGDRVVYIKFNENTRKAINDFKNLLNHIMSRLEREIDSCKYLIESIDKT